MSAFSCLRERFACLLFRLWALWHRPLGRLPFDRRWLFLGISLINEGYFLLRFLSLWLFCNFLGLRASLGFPRRSFWGFFLLLLLFFKFWGLFLLFLRTLWCFLLFLILRIQRFCHLRSLLFFFPLLLWRQLLCFLLLRIQSLFAYILLWLLLALNLYLFLLIGLFNHLFWFCLWLGGLFFLFLFLGGFLFLWREHLRILRYQAMICELLWLEQEHLPILQAHINRRLILWLQQQVSIKHQYQVLVFFQRLHTIIIHFQQPSDPSH